MSTPSIADFLVAAQAGSTPPSGVLAGLGAALLGLADHQSQGLALKDAEGHYLWVNDVLAGWMQRPAADWVGKTDLDLFGGTLGPQVRAGDLRAMAAAGVSAGEQAMDIQGVRRVFKMARTVVAEPQGAHATGVVLTAWWDDAQAREQSAQLQRALAQIAQQQVAFDKLDARYRDGQDRPTQLFRSENFEEHLRRELALSSREHREFALAVLVLEDAEAMTATHGPGCVARVSDAIVQMLRANTRTMDMISPLGAGRFGVLLSGVGLSTAYSRMDQFRRQCRTHLVVHEGVSVQFQVSAGVASFPHSAETLDALSEATEAALAEAARQGGHRVCVAALPLPVGAPAWRLPSVA